MLSVKYFASKLNCHVIVWHLTKQTCGHTENGCTVHANVNRIFKSEDIELSLFSAFKDNAYKSVAIDQRIFDLINRMKRRKN